MQEARRSRRARCSWVRAARGAIVGNVANSGTLAFNRSNTYTFGGLISGAGGVTQLGNGATVLRQQYLHWRHHDHGGHLAAGRGRGWIHGRRHRRRRDQQRQPACQSQQYLWAISGTGSVTQGNGTTVLTAANTYTGGTTITAGVLQLGAGGTTGSIVGNVSNNGALAFNQRYLHLRRDHQRHGIGHAAGQRHHHPDRQQYLHWRHHG